MNCTRIQEALTDFETGELSPEEATAVREHLKSCPNCQSAWAEVHDTLAKVDRFPVETPSPRLRAQFYAMLDTHVRDASKSASPFGPVRSRLDRWLTAFWPRTPALQFAAALALMVTGIAAGVGVASKAKPLDLANAAQLAATQKELADLRTRVDSVNQLVAYSLSQQQPAHARLQQVVSTLTPDGKDEPALAQLLSTLAFDPSTNIRLSALESLYAHAQRAGVREGVLAALPRETSPLVQVAMIDFLASVRDRDAVPTFQQIARTANADPSVRTAAERAIAML